MKEFGIAPEERLVPVFQPYSKKTNFPSESRGNWFSSSGGEDEIRTRGSDCSLRRFSKPVVSATHPPIRIVSAQVRQDF